MTIRLHRGDLPDLSRYTGAVAIDTETMGLQPVRDRLCVVQLSPGDGSADVVQIGHEIGPAPNLKALLADASKTKIFHFARFDIAILYKALGVMAQRVARTTGVAARAECAVGPRRRRAGLDVAPEILRHRLWVSAPEVRDRLRAVIVHAAGTR